MRNGRAVSCGLFWSLKMNVRRKLIAQHPCCCKILTLRLYITPYILWWASYQIRKIAGCACAGNTGNVSTRGQLQRKPLANDSGMHHGTCLTHVPWCMSGSLTLGGGENVPGIPGACAPAILRIWQEAHGIWRAWIINWINLIVICESNIWMIFIMTIPMHYKFISNTWWKYIHWQNVTA